MLLRRFADFILKGRLQAMLTAFVLTLFPFGGTISILIVGLVTLCKGVYEGSLVLLVTMLPYLVFVVYPVADTPQLTITLMQAVVISNVLTWMLAALLGQYNNWNFVLELAALMGIFAVCIIHVFYPDIQGWWVAQLTSYFQYVAQMLNATTPDAAPQLDLNDYATYATRFVITMVLLNALLQVVVTRAWQALAFNPGGLRKELYQIRLGQVAGVIFIIGLVLSGIGMQPVSDIVPVLYLTFGMAGLSLLHNVVKSTRLAWVWLMLIYTMIVCFLPYSVVLIALVALVDTWVDFRKRMV